jgi:hypothetical protein
VRRTALRGRSGPALGEERRRFTLADGLHCLPATRAEDHVTANGTVLRPATLQAWASAAGFPTATVPGIDDDLWRFYRL